ncbi:MAG: hydrolase [Rhodospirillales bacterium]|nr:hydrolase [Rhodospirillales bacterium]
MLTFARNTSPTSMRFASYNVQYGTGKDGRVDLARIAAEIGDADVIALQEVDCFFERSGNVDQARAFAALFPEHHWVFGAGLDVDASLSDASGRLVHRRRRFGNMLLARWPILSSRNHLLPKDGLVRQVSLQRSAIEGVIAPPGGPIRVYSVHLAHASAPERVRQVERLKEILMGAPSAGGVISGRDVKPAWLSGAAPPPMPCSAVVMGDFNATSDTREYEILCGAVDPRHGRLTTIEGLVDAWVAAGNDVGAGTTFRRDGAPVRIDYIFVTPELAGGVRSAAIGSAAVGSDHQPIFAEIEIAG